MVYCVLRFGKVHRNCIMCGKVGKVQLNLYCVVRVGKVQLNYIFYGGVW
jgi:hypothetical protein